jgi:hypothetical protein
MSRSRNGDVDTGRKSLASVNRFEARDHGAQYAVRAGGVAGQFPSLRWAIPNRGLFFLPIFRIFGRSALNQ